MNSINILLDGLSDLEKQQVLTMLEEINNGESNTYSKFVNDIWDEVPVDIDTFLDDERYLRNYVYPDGKNCIVYPYWRDRLKELYKNPYQYSECAVTGGIGLGKSEIAKIALCYLSYRLLCLKNPQLYYNKPFGKPIVVLFMNKTKELAEKVLLQPFVDMLQTSPWFNKNGRFVGREHIRYIPYKNIRFEGGSQSGHGLGQDIFCLYGDTKVLTSKGYIEIKRLKDSFVKVYTYNPNTKNITLSNDVFVKETKKVTELIEMVLEDDTIIKCTPEHKFLLKNGLYKMAKDLTTDDDLEDITSFNSCGIYKITNLVNNKAYIGLSYNIFNRFKKHLYSTTNKHLNNAFKKYGMNNFKFEILEVCLKEKCKERERYWIAFYETNKTGYNKSTGGECTDGYQLNEEIRDKISLKRKNKIAINKDNQMKYIHTNELDEYLKNGWELGMAEYVKKKIGRPGRIISASTRQKLSIAHKGKKLTEEHKKRLSETSPRLNTFARLSPEKQLEVRRKISQSTKHRDWSNYKIGWKKNGERSSNSKWINNGKKELFIINDKLESYLNEGWTLGRINITNNSKIGCIWVNKNYKNKQIKANELEKYLEQGYIQGMYKKYKHRRYFKNEN